MLSRVSLRARLAVLTCTVLIVACAFLTMALVLHAGITFDPLYARPVPPVPVLSGNTAQEEAGLPETTEDAQRSFEASRQTFTFHSILLMLAVIIVGTAVAWIMAGKALKPVTELSNTIENIDESNLSTHIPVPLRNDEVARLTKSFNHMLVKIGDAFESQKRFSQNAAHELKTPISSMLANIEVLELDENPDIGEYKETMAAIKNDVVRMNSLVADLLTLHSSDSSMEMDTFTMGAILRDIVKSYESEIRKRRITVDVQGDREFRGNRFLLGRAFSNIIGNAVRYNRDNGSIIIRCSEGSVSISDTGIGIPDENLQFIFEPFYCVDASRSRALGGSGLGLAIAKEIFDKHHMRISVSSKENAGTTITVSDV